MVEGTRIEELIAIRAKGDLLTGSSPLNLAMVMYKCAKEAGDDEEMSRWQQEAQRIHKELISKRQASCHHEFFKGRDKCCRCGIERTPENEKLAEERRGSIYKRRKKK